MITRYDLISIFPEYFRPLELSLIGKARESNLIDVKIHDLRDHGEGVHRSVDDTPYGGGAGMVMMPEPWGKAIDPLLTTELHSDVKHHLIILTPAGKKFTQAMAEEFSRKEHLIFACGRYEGIDHRVTEFYSHHDAVEVHEVSIGDYVLNGGEVATLVILEAVIRLIPGVLGNPLSLVEESHSLQFDGESMVEYPKYTKPASWRGLDVPPILMSGNHGAIAAFRRDEAEKRSRSLE